MNRTVFAPRIPILRTVWQEDVKFVAKGGREKERENTYNVYGHVCHITCVVKGQLCLVSSLRALGIKLSSPGLLTRTIIH